MLDNSLDIRKLANAELLYKEKRQSTARTQNRHGVKVTQLRVIAIVPVTNIRSEVL